jgi:hypothetical protein
MKSASILFFSAALGVCMLSVTRNASALGPVDVEVAAKVGGGTNPVNVGSESQPPGAAPSNPPNPLGFGLGGRAGASFMGFYGGLSFMFYLGESQVNQGVTESLKSILYGGEAGYNIRVSILTLRPQLGIGNFTRSQNWSGGTMLPPGSTSTSSLYLEPGLTGLLAFGMWIVGADANVLFLTGLSGAWPAFTAHGQVGIKF